MDAYEAIMTRRSVPKVSEREPDMEAIEKLLQAGVRAPTHHLTQPWRFIVLRGDALEDFGRAWAVGTEREGKDPGPIPDKARRAPVVIAVIESPKHHLPKVQEIEEHHATGAAIQNMLLAAHALGLGAMLRTGPAAHIPEVRDYLGLGDTEFVAGYIYLGFPRDDVERPMTRRTEPAKITEWRGWE
jgi:nitroreductase